MKVAIEMISIAFIFSLSLKEAFCEQKNSEDLSSVIITVVYDNNEYDPRLGEGMGIFLLSERNREDHPF